MKRIYLLVAFLVGMFLVPITTVAEITKYDLEMLDPDTAAQVLRELSDRNKKAEVVPPTAETVDKWVGLAERFGKALATMAKEAGIAINDFVKTPVGLIAIGILLWKVVGVSMVAGLVWVVTLVVLIWSFRKFHVPIKTVVTVWDGDHNPVMEEGKVVTEDKYIRGYTFSSNDARVGSAWAHGGMFVLINIMLIVAVATS